MEKKDIKLSAIEVDKKSLFEYDVRQEGITRVEGHDDPSVESLIESIKGGRDVPPIMVYPLKGGKYQVINGRRRLLAHRQLNFKTIRAKVVEKKTSPSKLLELSFLEDVTNGNSIEVSEKRKSFERYLLMVESEKGNLGSQESLAKTWGISQASISRAISGLKEKGELKEDFAVSEAKQGRKGKTKSKVSRSPNVKALPPELEKAKTIRKYMRGILERYNDKVLNHLVDLSTEKSKEGEKMRVMVKDCLTLFENVQDGVELEG